MGQITCSECGIGFAVPETWHQQRRDSGKSFYCPNGHGQCYNRGKTKADLLAEELSRAKQNNAYLEDLAQEERRGREMAERQRAAARGQVTKLKKRAAAGICPCCNRQFTNLMTHMAQKHPGFAAEPIAGDTHA